MKLKRNIKNRKALSYTLKSCSRYLLMSFIALFATMTASAQTCSHVFETQVEGTYEKHVCTQCNGAYFSIPAGEVAMCIMLENDETIYAFPKALNPSYDFINNKVTFTEGQLQFNKDLASISAKWEHNFVQTENENHIHSSICNVNGCGVINERWVMINGVKTLTTKKESDVAIESLKLSDETGYECEAKFVANTATYSRSISNTWASLCLPYAFDMTNQTFRAFTINSVSDDAVVLDELEGNIDAGKPLLIKMHEGETSIDINVTEGEVVSQPLSENLILGCRLEGLFKEKTFTTDDTNHYIVSKDKLMNPAKILNKSTNVSVKSKPFRAYMVENQASASAKAYEFSFDGTTSINQLNAIDNGEAEYYDINGRRISDLQKGVNIIKRGNKTMKVIIK